MISNGTDTWTYWINVMHGKHRSLDKEMKRTVKWLHGIEGVTKIVLGFSESCRHKFAPGFIKFKMDVAGGIKINGYSGNGVTDIFVRIDPINLRNEVKAQIKEKFPL